MLWGVACFLALLGTFSVGSELRPYMRVGEFGREKRRLVQVSDALGEIQGFIETGLLPPDSAWRKLGEIAAPWRDLVQDALMDLRRRGGSLLPTVRRLKALAQENQEALELSRNRAAQAWAQACVCIGLIPFFGVGLYSILPGIETYRQIWALACSLAGMMGLSAAIWILRISDRARWGGLRTERRPWPLAIQILGERLLALIRSGLPADLAWSQAHERLRTECPTLADFWGGSVWQADFRSESGQGDLERYLVETGDGLRRAIQTSLMEGQSCSERVELVLHQFRKDVSFKIERELNLLGNRALKPLFILVAPALLGLLMGGMYLVWVTSMEGM